MSVLILVASFLYLFTMALYGAHLVRLRPALERAGQIAYVVALLAHVAAVVVGLATGRLTGSSADVLLGGSALLGVTLVLPLTKRRSPLVCALASALFAFLLYSLHAFDKEASHARAAELRIVTPVHITASILGYLGLLLAASAATVSVLQEVRLRTKKHSVGTNASRLPSIQSLERFSHTVLLVAFPIYTTGVALGAVWLSRGADPSHARRHFIMAGFSWALTALAVHVRVVLGWQGRRAALPLWLAFFSATFVVLLSALRSGA